MATRGHERAGARIRRTAAYAVLVTGLFVTALVGCSDDGDDDGAAPGSTVVDTPAELSPAPAELEDALEAVVTEAPECDWLDSSECLFPFPSSRFEADADTETGRQLAFPDGALPVNDDGVAVEAEPFSRSDGWGVGTPIMVTIEGVDPEASNFPSEADPSTSVEDGSGTVIVDMTSGERVAHWTEVDARPEIAEADRTTVLLHPLIMLEEGHQYAVGIRRPVDVDGEAIEVSPGFQVVRDRLETSIDAVEERRERLDTAVAAVVEEGGIPRAEQWLAWDFTIMSTENLTGELISMRDQAFEELGEDAPGFTVTEVLTTDDDGDPLPDGVARRVRGTYEVPSFIEGDGSPGQVMARDADGNPELIGTYTAEFTCALTDQQLNGGEPAQPLVYGHGLLGSWEEAERGDLGLAAANLMACGTSWIGMSEPDVPYAVSALSNINGFPSVADRLRQGVVNQLFLARLLTHEDGFAAAAEFSTADGQSTIDTDEVFYEGHSQGGIMGFVATAVSTEWTKAVIGVPGIDYALLIPRSNNWQTYGPVIAGGYSRPVDGLLILALLQQQWDRAEGSGYVRYLTENTLPGTPEHQAILQVAFGDHQVTNVSAEIAARTAGVPIRVPALDDAGHDRVLPPFQMETHEWDEPAESLLIYWDAGTLPAPLGDLSPDFSEEWTGQCEEGSARTRTVENAACADPHEFPRRTPEAQQQRNTFFATGLIEDVCGPEPCRTEPRER